VRGTLTLAGVGAGAGLAYAAGYEVRAFTLRRHTVPVLPPGHATLRVLHLSDLHLTPRQRTKQQWVASLAGIRPDLVVTTGDLIAHRDGVSALAAALDGLLDVPGIFVRGSNDYFAPELKNPGRYLLPDDGRRSVHNNPLPTADLDALLTRSGWRDLDNARTIVTVGDTAIDVVGTDDAHLSYDRYDTVSGPRAPDADLLLGVTHAPYLRVLDAMVADGADLVLAGHTHGGQLCLPGGRALVTNCDLDTERARGLSTHPADGGPGSAWLHVSGGLGTSPMAPVRFACRPEASLLTLVERTSTS
jgi:predicted MPP superfamily phosphohydrolase